MIKFFKQLLMFHVKLTMAEGEGGGGEGGGGEPGPDEGGARQRPDFVPEKFWNSDKGEIRAEDAFKSYTELEKKIQSAGEEAVTKYKETMTQHRPKQAEDYQVEINGDWIPEGMEFKVDDADPLLSWFKDFAFERNLSQEDFTAAVSAYVKSDLERGQAMAGSIDELGENGQERIDRINLFLQRILSDDAEYQALAGIITSPKAVMALERIIDKRNEPNLFKAGSDGDTGVTRAQLKEMMADPRYWKEKNPEYIKEVQAHYDKLYPGTHKGQGKAA